MEQNIGFLTSRGFVVPVSTLRRQMGSAYDKLLQKLTIKTPQIIGPQKIAKMYHLTDVENVHCIYLPRTMIVPLLAHKVLSKIENLLPAARPINAFLNTELFVNQQIIVNYLQQVYTPERVKSGTACALLNLRAGMGKTFVAAGLINSVKLSTLYIVPKRPLMVQAVKDLRACFYPDDGTVPTISIGQYGKAKKSDPSSDPNNQEITVIVINSALERNDEFFRRYSLIIYDEVHSYCTETRRKIFRMATGRMCLGMTATSENRNDGFDPIAHKELAFDNIIRAENIDGFTYEDVKFNCQARLVYYHGASEHTQNLTHDATGKVFTHYMHAQALKDTYRNKAAVLEILELYDWRGPNNQQHCIYLFSEELGNLREVMQLLKSELITRGRNDAAADLIIDPEIAEGLGLEMFTGGLKDSEITRISNHGRILGTTFGYGGTGTSIPKMTAMVLLTSRKANMLQILARIMRRGSDLSIPRVVVDIIDAKTCLRNQLGARRLAYDHYGFVEETKKIKWDMVA